MKRFKKSMVIGDFKRKLGIYWNLNDLKDLNTKLSKKKKLVSKKIDYMNDCGYKIFVHQLSKDINN